MQFEDRLHIETPEGVTIDLHLAGLGSRFGAASIDILILGAAFLVLILAFSLVGGVIDADLGVFALGIGSLLVAATLLGYFIAFETFNNGRTPGKAAFGIRVVSATGSALTVTAVAIRTLMRLVDFLPGAYGIGAISVFVSEKNQRLGDIAANTVVVRDRVPELAPTTHDHARTTVGWDVSAITEEDLAVVRRFLARRTGLDMAARSRISASLATSLRPRVVGGETASDEMFLEQLVVEKQDRR